MRVELLHNGQVVTTKDFGEGNFKIGRSAECDLRIKSPQVSKQHALLVIKGNKAAIVDLGSSNGVFVNGILVRKQRIEPGDEVTIVDFVLRLSSGARPAPRRPASVDAGAARNLAPEYEPPPAGDSAPPEVQLSPQERLLALMDQKVMMPFYQLMKTADWRWILSCIILGALVCSVLLSVIPIVRWGKAITTKEALARAHTIVAQSVRENYRILSKTNDVTRLTVEACESEQGILACYIVDPKSNGILAPAKLFNKSVTDVYSLLAIKRVIEGKEETVSVERDNSIYIVAEPIYLFSPDSNDRQLNGIVLANFQVPTSIASTFQPMVEAALFAVLLSLMAYFLISKMVTYPIVTMQEQLDAALKGEDVSVTCEARFPELETLATVINFSVSRLRQAGIGAGPITSNNTEEEDKSYVNSVQEFDQGSSDAILLLDKDKKVKYVGKALEDMLSMRNQYAQGQNISDACRDPSFAGTCIDLCDRVFSTLGETQHATLDINGIARNMVGVGHKTATGELHFVLVTVKLNA